MTALWAAVAIGGTRSTVALARAEGPDGFGWLAADRLATSPDPGTTLAQLTGALAAQLAAARSAGPARWPGSASSAAARSTSTPDLCWRRPTCRSGRRSMC